MFMAAVSNDSFELYDLRVEVVAPEGAKLYCGAKVGDYFELKGEMLYLPAGQGMDGGGLVAGRHIHPDPAPIALRCEPFGMKRF